MSDIPPKERLLTLWWPSVRPKGEMEPHLQINRQHGRRWKPVYSLELEEESTTYKQHGIGNRAVCRHSCAYRNGLHGDCYLCGAICLPFIEESYEISFNLRLHVCLRTPLFMLNEQKVRWINIIWNIEKCIVIPLFYTPNSIFFMSVQHFFSKYWWRNHFFLYLCSRFFVSCSFRRMNLFILPLMGGQPTFTKRKGYRIWQNLW